MQRYHLLNAAPHERDVKHLHYIIQENWKEAQNKGLFIRYFSLEKSLIILGHEHCQEAILKLYILN